MDVENIVKKIVRMGGGKVKFVFLYGSRAKGLSRRGSDIDLCIYYSGSKRERFEFQKLLMGTFPNLDVKIFQDAPLYLLKHVIEEGDLLYVEDIDFAFDIIRKTQKEIDDYMPRYLEALKCGT